MTISLHTCQSVWPPLLSDETIERRWKRKRKENNQIIDISLDGFDLLPCWFTFHTDRIMWTHHVIVAGDLIQPENGHLWSLIRQIVSSCPSYWWKVCVWSVCHCSCIFLWGGKKIQWWFRTYNLLCKRVLNLYLWLLVIPKPNSGRVLQTITAPLNLLPFTRLHLLNRHHQLFLDHW